MSFDTNQKTKLDIAFKKLLNKSALNINDVSNSEPIGTNISISTSTIFAEAITSTPGVTGNTPDVNYDSDTTVEHIRFIATAHPDSNVSGKYHAYTLSLPATYETRSTQANKATTPFGSNKVLYESLGKLQLVPPSFGGPYAAKPYRAGTENVIGSGTEIPPLATEAWVIDYYSGILYLENPTNDLITFVDAYLYIGDMADQSSSSSSSDLISEGDAKVETTDTGSGNSPTNITFSTGHTASDIPNAKWNIIHGGHIIPEVTEKFDIGSAEKKVRHLFLSDNSLTIGGTTLSANGGILKWGDATLAKTTDITSGTASKANALATTVNVAGVPFDGSTDIEIPAISTTTTIIYCDANRSDTYTEDGTLAYPYKTLTAATAAKCTNTATETVVFCLASGDYVGSVSITKTSTIEDPSDPPNTIPNPGLSQEVYIIGENKESVRIMGSSTFDTSTGDVLFLRRFKNVSIQNLTIMNGAYGFYPRECTTTSIINCIFRNCGSSGDTTMHDGSGSEAQQAKYKWSSGDALAINTSNGGAMRVRACNDIEIRDNLIEYCFRGFRIQDCRRGNISNNRVHKILDNGIYLASGDYNGSTSSGCENLSVTNNIVEHAGHHGLLVVGGRNNTFKNNVIKHSWGTAYNGAHAVNVDLIGNYFYNNNSKDYNGYGPGGEHLAQIYAYALAEIDDSTNTKYLLQVVNNVFEESGNGSTGSSRLFYINSAKAELPAAGQVLTVHNNVHDCTTDYDITDWEVTYPKATFGTLVANLEGNVSSTGTLSMTATTDIALNSDIVTFNSANTTDPLVTIKNSTNDANGARLRLSKDKGAVGAKDDVAGLIQFYADNDKSGGQEEQVNFAEIKAQVDNPSEGSEGGKLSLSVANFDGTLTEAITINGSSQFTDSTCDYNNSITIAIDDNEILLGGMSVSGPGIPAGSYIVSVGHKDDPDNTFRINQSTTGGAYTNQTLTFGNKDNKLDITIGKSSSDTITLNGNLDISSLTLGTATAISSNGNTFDAPATTFTNGIYDGYPLVEVKNTNSGNVGSTLWFTQDRGAGADGDTIGTVVFKQENDADSTKSFGEIDCKVSDASADSEGGKLSLKVASHDGEMVDGIVINGSSQFTVTNCSYNNSTTITVSSTALVKPGMYVTGDGIPSGAQVASVTNSTIFELDATTTGGAKTNETLTFGNVEDEVDVTIGSGVKSTVTIPGTLKLGGTDIAATATELNILDGDTAGTTTTVANGHRIILNDNGTMKQVTVDELKTYTNTGISGGASNLSGLSDVTIDSPDALNSEVLVYTGSINGFENRQLGYSDLGGTPNLTINNLSNVNTGVATNGDVLTWDTNQWVASAPSGGSSTEFKFAIITDAGDHTITNSTETHQTFLFNKGTGAVILPKGVTAGTIYNIKNINTNQLELQCPDTGTATFIDGEATTRNLNRWDNITLIKYGSAEDWAIL